MYGKFLGGKGAGWMVELQRNEKGKKKERFVLKERKKKRKKGKKRNDSFHFRGAAYFRSRQKKEKFCTKQKKATRSKLLIDTPAN